MVRSFSSMKLILLTLMSVNVGTKIGALFVANSGHNGSGDLELTKLTLWG